MDKIAKAIIGAVTAAGAALVTAQTDGHITATEWALMVDGRRVAGLAVYDTTNAPAQPKP